MHMRLCDLSDGAGLRGIQCLTVGTHVSEEAARWNLASGYELLCYFEHVSSFGCGRCDSAGAEPPAFTSNYSSDELA